MENLQPSKNKNDIFNDFFEDVNFVFADIINNIEKQKNLDSTIKQCRNNLVFNEIEIAQGEEELLNSYSNFFLKTNEITNIKKILITRSHFYKLIDFVKQNSTPELDKICQNLDSPNDYTFHYPDILD